MKAWSDKTTKEYKILKGLKKENLRDASKKVAKQGGNVAKVARKELEARTGKKVVTSLNAKSALQLKSSTEKKKKK